MHIMSADQGFFVRKIILSLALITFSSSLLAGLSEKADMIANGITELIIRTERVLNGCEEIERSGKVWQRMLALKNTYRTLSEAKLIPQISGPGGMIAPDLSYVIRVAKENPIMRLKAEIFELVSIIRSFNEYAAMIKKLHGEYALTYKLWLFLKYNKMHSGAHFVSEILIAPFTRDDVPIAEIRSFIDLLQQTLRCVLVYTSTSNESIDHALSIYSDINSHMPFSGFDA